MKTAIQNLADRFGILLSARNASDSYLYDGASIALFRNRYLNEDDFVVTPYTDDVVLHEICHWLACSDPEQRLFPEYGLAMGIGELTAMGDYANGGWYGSSAFEHGLIDVREQGVQEALTQLLSVHFGQKLGIRCLLYGSPMKWDIYRKVKEKEHRDQPGWWELWEEANARLPSLLEALGE